MIAMLHEAAVVMAWIVLPVSVAVFALDGHALSFAGALANARIAAMIFE